MRGIESELSDVRQLLAAGRLADACERCGKLVQLAPMDPRGWRLAAEVAFRSNKPTEALEFLRRAMECAPHDASLLIQYGQCLMRLGRRTEALAIALQAEKLVLDRPPLEDALGTLLTHVEQATRAVPYFQRAVQNAPTNVDFRYNLAMAQRMTGDLEAAEANLDIVIAARPDDAEAYSARSDLRKQTRERNHVVQLLAVHRRLKGRRAAFAVEFALAKELEDLGEYSSSFSHLHAACQSYRALLRYDVAEDVAVLEKLRTTQTAETLGSLGPGFDTQECIFIIGLPRSGTTLVERILASHSEVYAAGELQAFPKVVIEAVTQREGRCVKKLDFVDSALQVDFKNLGRAYLDATRPQTGHTARFTDKLPLNYLYAGLIHVALPESRFVVLKRHPMDSCFAMYRTLFADAYPFTYDLRDLSRYYVAWDRLMRHWESVIGDAWLSVSYEELVADQEGVSRKIVAHCGLAWEERCLDFHSHPAAVTTASAAQVRRPLYSESVGKWRRYADQLEPLALELEANGISVR
jgi:tetratricopeptide (TPR) repeat protein